MERIAIFPGSFDPFTRGHAAVVEQALTLFDRVVVAVGCNNQKQGLLSLDARLALLNKVYGSNKRVEVTSYGGLTVDFARRCGAVAMVRGVRGAVDFDFEQGIAAVNRRLNPSIATVLLFAPASLADISSSVVRELHLHSHGVEEFLPEGIKLEDYL